MGARGAALRHFLRLHGGDPVTEEELEAVLRDHEERLHALEVEAGLATEGEQLDPREAAHQALVTRIHGERKS